MNPIIEKIIPNVIDEVPLLSDFIDKIDVYEKEPGKYYIKSHDAEGKEKLVWNEEKQNGQPEEIIRQLFLYSLTDKYKYPLNLIFTEQHVYFGREKKRLDVIVFQKDKTTAWIVAEIKAPSEKNNVKQLKSYANSEGAVVSAGTNGKEITIFVRPYPKEFRPLPDLPFVHETNLPDDILNRDWKLDKLRSRHDLREIVETLEDTVLANSGVDAFNEIFKLIYAKLYDEYAAENYINRGDQELLFRQYKEPTRTFDTIADLFDLAKDEWKGVFEDSDQIKLKPNHLDICVSKLAELRLFGADLRVIDEAFEFLVPAVAKSKKGQYFTPRVVIDTMVQMMNPKANEYIIDPACGSAGFLVHTMQYVWDRNNMPTNEARRRYAGKYLWGIDFDEKSTKISRAIMLIAGDGKSHIYQDNSLDFNNWMKHDNLTVDLKKEGLMEGNDAENLKFDLLLANPPFAGNVEEDEILKEYELAQKNGKRVKKISRHLLFIERFVDMLKPGGRLAIVLPQGVFNNTSEKYVRDYVSQHGRIISVLSLHGNSFKPHTGTKTSVLFVQKWNDDPSLGALCSKVKDYPIFFAVSDVSFKDNSGNYVYKDEQHREYLTDLFEIKDEFIKWAKHEKLSFWK